jgi:hypothetical protein
MLRRHSGTTWFRRVANATYAPTGTDNASEEELREFAERLQRITHLFSYEIVRL